MDDEAKAETATENAPTSSLWDCPDCGRRISRAAAMCPGCGRRFQGVGVVVGALMKDRHTHFTLPRLAFVVVLVALIAAMWDHHPEKTSVDSVGVVFWILVAIAVLDWWRRRKRRR